MVSALFGQDVGLDGKAHYLKSQIPNSRKEDNLQRQLRKNIVTVSSVNRSKVHAQFQVCADVRKKGYRQAHLLFH